MAATTRRTHAEALTAFTTAMINGGHGKPDDKLIRKALGRWAFNTTKRNDPTRPAQISTTLRTGSVFSRRRHTSTYARSCS